MPSKFIGEKTLYLVIIALLITAGGMGWLLQKKQQIIQEKENQIVFLTDTIKIERNERGQSVSKSSRLEAENAKSFLAIKNLTGDNKRLQEVLSINKNRLGPTGSISVITTNTSIDEKVPTIVKNTDTTKILGKGGSVDTIKIYPTYIANINLGKWVKADIVSTKDSTSLKAKIVNDYDLVIGEEPIKGTGFLGIGRKYKPFSEVTNLNPYSETTTLKTFSIKDTRKKSKVGLIVVGALGFIGGILIAK